MGSWAASLQRRRERTEDKLAKQAMKVGEEMWREGGRVVAETGDAMKMGSGVTAGGNKRKRESSLAETENLG